MNSFTTTDPMTEEDIQLIKKLRKEKTFFTIAYYVLMILAICDSCLVFVLWVYRVIKNPVYPTILFIICGMVATYMYVQTIKGYDEEIAYIQRTTL